VEVILESSLGKVELPIAVRSSTATILAGGFFRQQVVGDSQSAAIFALDTGDRAPGSGTIDLADVDAKVAAMLGVGADLILINDMVVNPISKKAYLSVSRGKGPDAIPVIVRIDSAGKINELDLANIAHAKADLPNPVSADAKDRRGRPLRSESITDIGYLDGKVFVAGLSNEEIASNLITALPQKFALAGLSMGGIVAMEILRRTPDRVTRIALMDTNCLAETPQVAANREPQIIKARSGRLEDVMRDEMKPNYLAPGPRRIEVLNLVLDMAMGLGPEVFVRQSRALQRRRDHQSTLRRIRQPALVLCGEHDALCPVKRHQFMAELIPYAELTIIPEAGHLPTLEQPEATTEALRAWMRQPLVLR